MTDPRLPQLELALDPDAMIRVLEREWLDPAGDFYLSGCRVDYVRYKPGRNCVICYELTIQDRASRHSHRQILCGIVYEDETRISAKRWRQAARRPSVAVRFSLPVTHLAELHMVVWAFPNDRRMSGLEALFDPEHLRTQVLPGFLPRERIVEAQPELVRYVPENRCTIRVTVQTEQHPIVVYAKTYGEGQGELIFERLLALWTRRTPNLLVPRPLGYRAGVLWLAEVPGESMESRFDPAAARAVAALHRQDPSTLDSRDRRGLSRQLGEVWSDAQATGLASARLAHVSQKIERRLDQLEALPRVTIHGDLTPKNLLAAGDTAGLVDLDELRCGDPLEDIGSFNAVIYHLCVVNGTPVAEAESKTAAFSETYADAVPWHIREPDLRWRTAHALVSERIGASIKRRNEGVVDGLLTIAEHLLE